jgi:hypothetical protein
MTTIFGVYIKDLKGDADVNNIRISFTSGELCDGDSTITIANEYGWVTLNPLSGDGAWYRPNKIYFNSRLGWGIAVDRGSADL